MEGIRLEETERDAGLLSKFLDDMMPARLSWQFPREKDYFWVFWNKEKTSDHHFSVQDRIKTALSGFKYPYSGEVLIQFWEASKILTTSDQPFAMSCLTDEKLIQYKKDCPINKIVADDDNPISRVFRRQLPEMSPDLSYYSIKEYPERDLALGCGFKATVALPVYVPSGQWFVGVLELLFTKYNDVALVRYVYEAERRIQGAGLGTVNPIQLSKYMRGVHLVLVEEELKGAMGQVRETHGLPLACIWARLKHSYVGRGDCMLVLMQVYDINGGRDDGYNHTSFYLPLTAGQGPVGKVFHSDKPCFCRDVTQLSIIDYPMAHFARMSRFTSCFVVCLQSIANKNRAFVLEFFLPRDNRHSGDLHNFLSSILTILKQHLKSFEVVTNDLFTEVDNLTESNVESSMVKAKNVICVEQGDASFTYNTLSTSSGHETTSSSMECTSFHTISSLNTYSGYETISISAKGGRCTEAEDSARSLRTIESTLNSTSRKPDIYTRPSGNRSNLDQSPSKINEPVDSETETGSSSCIKLSGRVMSASQYQDPTTNVCMGDSSLSDAPRSEASVVIARTIPPWTLVDVEMATINENEEEYKL